MIRKSLIIIICMFTCTGIFAGKAAATEFEPISVFDSRIYRELFGTEAMRYVFSDRAMIEQWLKVETALAKAEADAGIIPASAAKAIESAAKIENVDFDMLRKKTNSVGRGISPLLAQIKKNGSQEVSEYLHFGSTTQDIMDGYGNRPANKSRGISDQKGTCKTDFANCRHGGKI